MNHALIIAKKIFSISLLFNSILTIAVSIGILSGFYWFFRNWQPFYPYLIDGNILWAAIVAAMINIFPSVKMGRTLETGRFLFHHYFYGLIVLLVSVIFIKAFTPVPLFTIFLIDNTSIPVNAGRFLILGGLTLVLDDLPDISSRIESSLNWLKAKAQKWAKIISAIQLMSGSISLYLFIAVILAIFENPQWFTLANLILTSTVFITSITSIAFFKKKAWQKFAQSDESN